MIGKEEIKKGGKGDYEQLMRVWESSVRATHHFLKREDFEFIRKAVPGFFPQVDLYVIRAENKICAFMGLSGDRLEMLFVSAESRRKGYGRLLLEYAVDTHGVRKVDVNEQNTQAAGFYGKCGFKAVSRSEKDSMDLDYPILHLSL